MFNVKVLEDEKGKYIEEQGAAGGIDESEKFLSIFESESESESELLSNKYLNDSPEYITYSELEDEVFEIYNNLNDELYIFY